MCEDARGDERFDDAEVVPPFCGDGFFGGDEGVGDDEDGFGGEGRGGCGAGGCGGGRSGTGEGHEGGGEFGVEGYVEGRCGG